MFKTLSARIPRDTDLPDRVHRLQCLSAILDGTMYDSLPHPFSMERNGAGEYIPLADRRPSVQYPLSRNIVTESTGLVFSASKFPFIDCEERETRELMGTIVREIGLVQTMLDASIRGSVGSIALYLRVLKGRIYVDSRDTRYLTPIYDPEAPDTLLRVIERYKVKGAELIASGYLGLDPLADYWFQRHFERDGEVWFQPQLKTDADDGKAPIPDDSRTVMHHLGFVPMEWIRNLPGSPHEVDGCSTFAPAISAQIEIDYHLSQLGRGLKYSSDPTLVLKSPSEDGQIVRGAANAMVLDTDGDAELLQLDGKASEAVLDYVRTLREFGLESVRGNRTSPEKLSAAQSGRAIEVMNAALYHLADDLRLTYGRGLLNLLAMIVKASNTVPLTVAGKAVDPIPADTVLNLRWPEYVVRDAEDKQAQATQIEILVRTGVISRETATAVIANDFSIHDLPAELARIKADQAELLAQMPEAGRQLKITE